MPAVFLTESAIPLKAFVDGVNSHLPDDIAVQSAEEVPEGFRAIGGARAKTYRYTIYNSPVRSPLERRTSWHVRETLDIESMRRGAALFAGEHDFASFRGQNCSAVTSRRRIDDVRVQKDGPFVIIDVTGGGFLKYMVRVMAGTLVDVGRGRFRPEQISELLTTPDRRMAGVTAPPQGLCLLNVMYPDHGVMQNLE
jgi:tRNA pseudouridine38-40 synthase